MSLTGWCCKRALSVGAMAVIFVNLPGCAGVSSGGEGMVVVARPPEQVGAFLAAGDYRRAIEACQEDLRVRPSVGSYLALTYVYQALGAFLEDAVTQDRWSVVEQVVRNLNGDHPAQLIDAPDVLPRIAKELISDSLQRQSDVAAAMAARLDGDTARRLWSQQAVWRRLHPRDWWHGLPPAWR